MTMSLKMLADIATHAQAMADEAQAMAAAMQIVVDDCAEQLAAKKAENEAAGITGKTVVDPEWVAEAEASVVNEPLPNTPPAKKYTITEVRAFVAERTKPENRAQMAAKKYATLASRLTNLKNKAVLYAQTLGDDMRPTIERVMESISQFIERLQGMDQSQRLGIVRFVALTAAAGPVILIFGRLATGIGKITGVLGTFCTAVGKAGGGVSGLLTVLGKSPAVWIAVAAAVAYGTFKLLDWASGAKMAREATQELNDKANEWKDTAAETFYGKSGAGLSFFGMSEDDFKSDNTAKSVRAWMTGLIDVWTDGKGETNEIVTEWIDTWKSLTENTRTELQALQDSAKESGYTGVSDQIQADIDSLDSMDREISALLKKRQNGYLTDDEKTHLQELIDQRETIIIKYKLQPDSEAEGFQTILDKVEAEVARAQARGEQDADVSVYQNAMVAAAQGLATLNSEIDAQYDSEYALIQLMEDGAENRWDASRIYAIITNEKYVGDILMQKRYSESHITHKEVKNRDRVVPQYYIRDHHAPIITRKQYERCQRIAALKNNRGKPIQYPYGDMLVCPICGHKLRQHVVKGHHSMNGWHCDRDEDSCRRYIVRTKMLDRAMLEAINGLDAATLKADGYTELAAYRRNHWKIKSVDYYWLDEYVEKLVFGSGHTLTVYWKCGLQTTVKMRVTWDTYDPVKLAEMTMAEGS